MAKERHANTLKASSSSSLSNIDNARNTKASEIKATRFQCTKFPFTIGIKRYGRLNVKIDDQKQASPESSSLSMVIHA
ncbi:hypothetical protein VCV18_009168 [Metarhizium anisopliae]